VIKINDNPTMLIVLLICVGFFVAQSIQVPLNVDDHSNLIDLFVFLRIVPATPNTTLAWQQYISLPLIDIWCPNNFTFFGCGENGRIVWLDVTVPPQPPGILATWQSIFTASKSIIIRNLVGHVNNLIDTNEFEIHHSLITTTEQFGGLLSTAHSMTLINVTLPYYQLSPQNIPQNWANVTCHFVDVLFLCPLPVWVERCFGNATRPLRCLEPLPSNFSYGQRVDPCPYVCGVQCSSPGRDRASCESLIDGTGYFPVTPGYVTVDVTYQEFGAAQELRLSAHTGGLVTRIELWNLLDQRWTVVFDDPLPKRSNYVATTIATYYLPPIVTNRVRATLELWFELTDSVRMFSLEHVAWPMAAKPMPAPHKQCDHVVSLDERAMLDETFADSLCVRRVCLPLCTKVANYTFDRKIRAQWLVVDGGQVVLDSLPTNFEISPGTRVYQLDNRTIDSIQLPDVGAKRVRLVGTPLDGEPMQSPTRSSPRGVPGIIVMTRLVNVLETNLIQVTQQLSTEFLSPPPTTLLVNGNDSQPPNKQVEFGNGLHRMLAVVYADVRVHNGSINPFLVNRRVVQTPIDVLYVNKSIWFEDLVQHDVELNISDIDLFGNQTHFAVVARQTGAGSLFHWKPYPYQLVECSSNNDCSQCLSNEANIEPCRWCEKQCRPRATICTNQSLCENDVNVTSTTTQSSSSSTTTQQSTTSSSPQSTSQIPIIIDDRSQSIDIGLAIGIPFAIILMIGAIVGAMVWWKRKPQQQDQDHQQQQQQPQKESAEFANDSTYDDIENVRM
jgi:hypothetical protein